MQEPTGVPGLDEVLGGGFPTDRIYLVEGTPGTGKTTLALQWVIEGVKQGGPVLYMTLAETRDELEESARSHGWSLAGVEICEAAVPEEVLRPEEQYTVFHPTDVELNETTRQMLEAVDRLKPRRVVIDSLSEMRVMAQNPFRHRQQLVALKRYFKRRGCTVLMLDDRSPETVDLHLQTMVHGVIQLEQTPVEYGAERRRLRVLKMRGRDYKTGFHDFAIQREGLEVFPRLIATDYPLQFGDIEQIKSGIGELDELLGGGPRRGSSMMIVGTPGTGKSSLAQQFAAAAAARGEGAAMFTFDESVGSMLARADGLSMDFRRQVEAGRITVEPAYADLLSPGAFAHRIRRAAEGEDGHPPAKVVVIDSLNGYMHALPEERFLMMQLRELLTYLNRKGVVTFFIMAYRGLEAVAPVESTYLADGTILLRFFEAGGEIKQAIAAMKMRDASQERTIREMVLGPAGIRIGKPLRQFQGILTGVPQFLDGKGSLLDTKHDSTGGAATT